MAWIVVIAGGRVEFGLRAVKRARAAARLGGGEHPAGPGRLTRGQRGRTAEQRGRLAPATPAAGSFPGALEFGRGVVVRAGDGMGQVPGPLVWLGRACCPGQAGVDLLAPGERCPVVHRRPDQRMAETHGVANGDELACLGRGGGLQGEAKLPAGPDEQPGIPVGSAAAASSKDWEAAGNWPTSRR